VHLIVPFAAPLVDAGRPRLDSLVLPRLTALLARLGDPAIDAGDEFSLSPPHERALARALGWQGADGALPFAACLAAADGVAPGDLAWGLVTPVHWHVGTDQVSLLAPESLALSATDSRDLFEAAQPLFTSEGFVLAWGAPLRWYAAHESLAGLRTASLDRVIGRNVDRWLGSDPAARRIRRLQAEVQMLLHEHPVNRERERRGGPTVNSFWLSGCGVAQPSASPAPEVDARLRGPALAGDWAAWREAWGALDAGPLAALDAAARRGEAVALTLCGERAAAQFASRPRSLLQRLRARLAPPPVHPPLEAL
jgi:hypothetical protein